ncbi:hypothetical protein B0H13DRAFT_2370807 [Mycena leptocephala]|nr:hypothetical protein B0H13DRAFT_2370807 [Mycena leptocephala]
MPSSMPPESYLSAFPPFILSGLLSLLSSSLHVSTFKRLVQSRSSQRGDTMLFLGDDEG